MTSKTQKNEALVELTNAVHKCKEAGISIGLSPMYGGRGNWWIAIEDDKVTYDGTRLIIPEEDVVSGHSRPEE